jgi:hypothetical protein
MPDSRAHRGPHPADAESFAPDVWPRLQAAVRDYSWLLTRGYAEPSAIKVVGDRHNLHQRQRMAVVRSACTDQALQVRRVKQIPPERATQQSLWIDGFNVLTTTEVALGGGVILAARDGCYRDIAGVHGTYRKVEETRPAIEWVGRILFQMHLRDCVWLLDSPVGNSGRLGKLLLEISVEKNWKWAVRVVRNPDAELIATDRLVATADSAIIDGCGRWVNLARLVIDRARDANVIPMAGESAA